jgi:hypothetical protein
MTISRDLQDVHLNNCSNDTPRKGRPHRSLPKELRLEKAKAAVRKLSEMCNYTIV